MVGSSAIKEKQMIIDHHEAALYGVLMWDLNRLRIWRAVVKAESVTAAARNLQYTPASVSQHIIALQRSVGFPLYRRVGRGIEITEAGHRLARESEDLFAAAAKLATVSESIRTGPPQRVMIGSFSSAAKEWIPEVLRRTVRRFPDLRYDITTIGVIPGTDRSSGDIELTVESGHGAVLEVPGFDREVLIEDDYMVVMPHAHPFARSPEVAVAELAAEPMVDHRVPGDPAGDVIDHAARAAGFTPSHVARGDDHYGILAMVSAGIGVTVLPRLAIGDLPPGLTARPLVGPTPVRRVVLLVRREIAHLEYIEVLGAAVHEVARSGRGYAGDRTPAAGGPPGQRSSR